ncbi:hypothetical protein JZX93_07525 [Acidomonas methanolica]|nr:hypothetical protein [Acidomonas methanolica]
MKLIVSGLPNKQSASRLLAREITVKARRSHIMRKIQADSLANLVKFSMQIYKNENAEMILPVDIPKNTNPFFLT